MKLEQLEKYRDEYGRINIDKLEKDCAIDKVPETRGASNKEKDWFKLDDCDVLIRTENLLDEGVMYTTYAELIFEELAKQVDIPCAHYDLVTYKGENGVLSKNVAKKDESLVLMKDLLECSNRKHDVGDDQNIHIEDAFNAFRTFYREYDDFSKEDYRSLCNDFVKMAIFDIFTMSTDRHTENCGVLYDGKKVRLAPMFDNECSLMLDSSQEKIHSLLKNRLNLIGYAELECQKIYLTYDEEENLEQNDSQISKLINDMLANSSVDITEHEDWQNTINNLFEFGEEQRDFIQKCDKCLNITEAIKSVEKRIKSKLPEELCEFVEATFNSRKELIREELMLDDIEEEKEEITNDENNYCLE